MTWQTVALANVAPSAWKNGGGITRELLAWPHPTDWVFRLSVAEVTAAGPFSSFEGVQRWFAVLSGAGVQLRLGAQPPYDIQTLTHVSKPFCFDGALPVDCRLMDGATQDFNLMVRTNHAQARMRRVVGHLQTDSTHARTVAVWSGNTGAELRLAQDCAPMSPHTLAWQALPAGAALEVVAADALLMEIDLCP